MMKYRNLFYLLSGILAGLVLFAVWFHSLSASRGYWEAELEREGPHMKLTLRLRGSERMSLSRQLLLSDAELEAGAPALFKLPEEAERIPGAQLKFKDITLRPGRVNLEWRGHEIDLMTSRLIVDGKDYDWDQAAPIKLVD